MCRGVRAEARTAHPARRAATPPREHRHLRPHRTLAVTRAATTRRANIVTRGRTAPPPRPGQHPARRHASSSTARTPGPERPAGTDRRYAGVVGESSQSLIRPVKSRPVCRFTNAMKDARSWAVPA
ncbi:hypothetical protein GCM10007977_027630 [Dactylosporangium sucinum]|uniref:Uncharacterized protein n=1 Tax=Dactylosporangium sucinum TaxID=1424081 RepID=A0A917WRB2_9ACTN|nr:hypothetical protein GCM10007977_027630 [Dactylosporangium sucinum]